MLINRIGDFFLLMGIGCLFYLFRTVDFIKIFQLLNYSDNVMIFKKYSFLDLTCFFLFIGAVGKSAQIGLHTWLPDAMEGPTPVSALIHAATMVTAGVFLLIRSSHIIELSDITLVLIIFFGGTTAFFSATVSLFQQDIKKIIAYSTCSQLGYMFLSCGFSLYNVALYHLITHAFFKALLFLTAGSIIHSLLDEQNLKKWEVYHVYCQ
jgi:NADH-quinone oxidoreductase subunit L